jgi:hypothetical protein
MGIEGAGSEDMKKLGELERSMQIEESAAVTPRHE